MCKDLRQLCREGNHVSLNSTVGMKKKGRKRRERVKVVCVCVCVCGGVDGGGGRGQGETKDHGQVIESVHARLFY